MVLIYLAQRKRTQPKPQHFINGVMNVGQNLTQKLEPGLTQTLNYHLCYGQIGGLETIALIGSASSPFQLPKIKYGPSQIPTPFIIMVGSVNQTQPRSEKG